MRGLVRKTILGAAIAGSGIFVALGRARRTTTIAGASEHWRREHRHHVEERERWRHEPPLRDALISSARPVFVQPAPIMMPPAHASPSSEPQLQLHQSRRLQQSGESPSPARTGLPTSAAGLFWLPCCD